MVWIVVCVFYSRDGFHSAACYPDFCWFWFHFIKLLDVADVWNVLFPHNEKHYVHNFVKILGWANGRFIPRKWWFLILYKVMKYVMREYFFMFYFLRLILWLFFFYVLWLVSQKNLTMTAWRNDFSTERDYLHNLFYYSAYLRKLMRNEKNVEILHNEPFTPFYQ